VGALKQRLRHAFAVDEPGPADPTPEQQGPVDWFCRQVAKRRLSTASLVLLETSKPLNFVAAQTMHFFSPAVWALARTAGHEQYCHFAAYLERRGSMDYLQARIEHFEAEIARKKRDQDEAGASGESAGGPPPGHPIDEPPGRGAP